MRCPDCSKFVAYDEPEIEEVDSPILDWDEEQTEARFSAEFRLVLKCGECGSTELKETTFDFEEVVDIPEEHRGEGHGDYTLEVDDPEPTTRQQTHDRHGKPIKSARYRKSYYGVSASYTVSCGCGETIGEGTLEDDEQASGMEELV